MRKEYFAPNGFRYYEGGTKKYRAAMSFNYYSPRFKKDFWVREGDDSDGATGGPDIVSFSWWGHDELCATGKWSDGTPVTNLQASLVLFDILWSEKQYRRAFRWALATFFLGGGEARKNGMFWLKKPKALRSSWSPEEQLRVTDFITLIIALSAVICLGALLICWC